MKRLAIGSAGLVLAVGTTVAAMAPAYAQPQQDGLVNVAVGDVTVLQDVNVGVVANVVAVVCGLEVGPVAVLAETVDRSGESRTVCNVRNYPVRSTQN